MSFDPEKVRRYTANGFGEEDNYGNYVEYSDYAQLLSLLHDVSSEADPSGTLRELRQARETVKAQEVLIQELRAEIERLKGWG